MSKFVFPTLTPDQIEVKVKQVTSKGAILLLYKTARTDMDLLDEVVGPDNWTNDYREIKGNLYCGIGIKSAGDVAQVSSSGLSITQKEWVWKWDCGIESRTDSEGNQKKGEASDAFKRAGFRWGIGRELYSAPFIFARVPVKAKGSGFELDDKFQTFAVKEISYNDRVIDGLFIVDNKGAEIFRYGKSKSAKSMHPTHSSQTDKPEPTPPSPDTVPTSPEPITGPRMALPTQIDWLVENATEDQCHYMMNMYGISLEKLTFAQAEKYIKQIQERKSA